ncbi:PHP domain-containing protein [Allonocardiopsis opalescens]|nr:PHP domain-containing protein [Allonocardiopsis opalescens]
MRYSGKVSIDLHSHSNVSDGTEPPEEVIRLARVAGVKTLALTDHDTVGGLAAAAAVLPPGMTLIPGMELSCRYLDRSVHLLAYLFDSSNEELSAELRRIRESRDIRAREMVDRLSSHGIPINWEIVSGIAGDGVVGRPHIARAMVQIGAASDVQEVFDLWISPGTPGYVHRYALEPVRAVELVRAAGGVAVIAHPARGDEGPQPVELVERMAAVGLGGIEVDHPMHDRTEREFWRGVAESLSIVATGSSDDHGSLTGHRLGCETTDPDALEALIAGASGAVPLTGV